MAKHHRGDEVRIFFRIRERRGRGCNLRPGVDESSVAQPFLRGFGVRVVPGRLPVPVIGGKRLGGLERKGSLVEGGESACYSPLRVQKTTGPERSEPTHEQRRVCPDPKKNGGAAEFVPQFPEIEGV